MICFITSKRTLFKAQLTKKNSKSINPLKEGSDLIHYGLSKSLESNHGQLLINGQFCLCITLNLFLGSGSMVPTQYYFPNPTPTPLQPQLPVKLSRQYQMYTSKCDDSWTQWLQTNQTVKHNIQAILLLELYHILFKQTYTKAKLTFSK